MGRYDKLTGVQKEIVDTAMELFDDTFDSSEFGPFITEFTGFDQDRMALFLPLAVADVCVYLTYAGTVYTEDNFPYKFSVGKQCVVFGMIIETIRHLCRSYVEMPDTSRVGAPDVQRRDYLSRWQGLLRDYQDQLRPLAEKLNKDLLTDYYCGNRHIRTLVDYPSMAGGYMAPGRSERPQVMGGWW